MQASHLLDLPDLALEHIFSNLLPSDLASCMMCCTTLRTLLRPRQSAMVRAHSLGRKWVLRACGRSLFADVAARFEAGVASFDGIPPPHFQAWVNLGRLGTGNGQKVQSIWARNKFDTAMSVIVRDTVHICSFFYLCGLVKVRGFMAILDLLERSWDQAVFGMMDEEIEPLGVLLKGWNWDGEIFGEIRRVVNSTDFSLQPFAEFAGFRCFLGRITDAHILDRCDWLSRPSFRQRVWFEVCKSTIDLQSCEFLSTLWLVNFLAHISQDKFRDEGALVDMTYGNIVAFLGTKPQ